MRFQVFSTMRLRSEVQFYDESNIIKLKIVLKVSRLVRRVKHLYQVDLMFNKKFCEHILT